MSRREGDRYYTPRWATQALLDHQPLLRGICLFDPCCGDGRMAQQVLDAGRADTVRLNDIDQAQGCAHSHEDATAESTWSRSPVDLVVTNPPFGEAGTIARHALRYAKVAVALLLRITWLEPCNGRSWLIECPPTEMLVLPRISFTGTGVDSATCAWFIWHREGAAWKRGSIVLAERAESAGQLGLRLPPREPWVGSDFDPELLERAR